MSNEASNLKLIGASASKPPLGIVPMHPLVGVSRVLEDSAVKYAPFNYMVQSALDALEAYDSAELRHRLASTLLGGQVTLESYAAPDPDSGIPHIFHRIAGLMIIASLMIRDGVLTEDPGMGKRKRAKLDEQRAIDASYHMGTPPGDPPVARDEITDEYKPTPRLIALAERIAAREYVAHNPAPATVVIESRELGGEWSVKHVHAAPIEVTAEQLVEEQAERARVPLNDPDAERRAQTERNLEQLKIEQEKREADRLAWEWRCLACNGSGIVAGPSEYTTEQCATCKGTGQKTGAEGMRL